MCFFNDGQPDQGSATMPNYFGFRGHLISQFYYIIINFFNFCFLFFEPYLVIFRSTHLEDIIVLLSRVTYSSEIIIEPFQE